MSRLPLRPGGRCVLIDSTVMELYCTRAWAKFWCLEAQFSEQGGTGPPGQPSRLSPSRRTGAHVFIFVHRLARDFSLLVMGSRMHLRVESLALIEPRQ